MKNQILITLSTFLFFSCEPKIDNDFYRDLVYPAKEVTTKRYDESKSGEWVLGRSKSVITYNKEKRISKLKTYSYIGVSKIFCLMKTESYNCLFYTKNMEEFYSCSRTYLDDMDTTYIYKEYLISKDGNTKIYKNIRTIGGKVFTDTIKKVFEDNLLTEYIDPEFRYIHEYKKDKVVKTINYNDKGKLSSESYFKYDKSGLRIEEKIYSADSGDTITNTYEYPEIDNKGNWVKQITYIDGKIYNVTIREITY